MCIMKNGLRVLALALAVLAFGPPSYAQPTRDKASGARTTAIIRKCSVSGFNSAKEYNSSTVPWYTYANCMVEHGQRP
jgi:hypothetical protein